MGDPKDKHNEAVVIQKCFPIVSKNVRCLTQLYSHTKYCHTLVQSSVSHRKSPQQYKMPYCRHQSFNEKHTAKFKYIKGNNTQLVSQNSISVIRFQFLLCFSPISSLQQRPHLKHLEEEQSTHRNWNEILFFYSTIQITKSIFPLICAVNKEDICKMLCYKNTHTYIHT